jgi:hypothetical protein
MGGWASELLVVCDASPLSRWPTTHDASRGVHRMRYTTLVFVVLAENGGLSPAVGS